MIMLTILAASRVVPILSAGISPFRISISSTEKHLFISVSITPQASALTWLLLGANSLASAFVKLFSPPLDAE